MAENRNFLLVTLSRPAEGKAERRAAEAMADERRQHYLAGNNYVSK